MAGKRRISDDERALLDHVLRDVTPLKRERSSKLQGTAPELPEAPPTPPKKRKKPGPPPKQRSVEKAKPAPAPQHLDQRTRRKLVRGRQEIDATLDLHGLRQDEAHARLSYFVAQASARGARAILVITGKGSRSAQGETPGVLRTNVPRWLAEPSLRSLVWGVEEAGPRHGGSGAYYVMLRRRRD